MLVDVTDDEFRQGLKREGIEPLETFQKEWRDGLIMGNNVHRIRPATKAGIVFQSKSNALGQALHDGVHVHMSTPQLRPAITLK